MFAASRSACLLFLLVLTACGTDHVKPVCDPTVIGPELLLDSDRATVENVCQMNYGVYQGTCDGTRWIQVQWSMGTKFEAFDADGRIAGTWMHNDVGGPHVCGDLPDCAKTLPFGPLAIGENLCTDCSAALDPALAATWTDLAVEASATQVCQNGGTAWRGTCGNIAYVVANNGNARTTWLFDGKGVLAAVVEWNTGAMPVTCKTYSRGTPPAASLCGSWWQGWADSGTADKDLCQSSKP